MNLQYSMPPQITGSSAADAAALSEWCGGLLTQLKKIIINLEDSNIISVSADKLTGGGISLSDTELSSGSLVIDESSITLMSADENETKILIRLAVTAGSTELTVTDESGKRYIRLSGGKLDINADTITAGTITAGEISAEKMNISTSLTAATIHCGVLDAGTIIGQ